MNHSQAATVVGWTPSLSDPMKSRGLPGIDFDRKDSYVPAFFGAAREYGPDEGWQTVRRRKARAKAKAARNRWIGSQAQVTVQDDDA